MDTTVEYLRENHVKTRTDIRSADTVRPIISEIRMSRLSHPRATLYAMLLLAAVFLLFGVIVSALGPDYSPAPSTIEGSAMIFADWLFG